MMSLLNGKILSHLNKSNFLKDSFFMILTSLLAQLIPLFATPLLTRIYTPQQYGYLTLFISINSILFVLASGRYEVAIMLPKLKSIASYLVKLSILLSGFISLSIFIIILFLRYLIDSIIDSHLSWLIYLPVSVFFMCMYRAFMLWANRERQYKFVAISKILQYGLTTLLQLALGYCMITNGLIIGYTIGITISGIAYFLLLRKEIDFNFSKKRLKYVAKKYEQFPKISMLGALCNSMAPQISIFLISYSYSEDIVGQFGLANKIIYAPLLLITSSLSFIVFQRVSYFNNHNHKLIRPFLIKGVLLLFMLFFPLVPIAYFFGEPLFIMFFGPEWAPAGKLSFYLSIAALIKFSVSPFSTILTLAHTVKLGTKWQYLYLFSSILILSIAAQYDIATFILIFSIHEFVLYLLYFVFIYHGSRMSNNIFKV